MLDLAETLNPMLSARLERVKNGGEDDDEDEDLVDTTLQLVFFDGEEAFKDWTDTDSIYGARCVVPCLLPLYSLLNLSQASGLQVGLVIRCTTRKATPHPLDTQHRNLGHRTPHPARPSWRTASVDPLILHTYCVAIRRDARC